MFHDWFNWREYAACNGMDTNMFFDKYEEDELVAESVRKLCSNCPVQEICLTEGMENGEWGVWGGELLRYGKVVENV